MGRAALKGRKLDCPRLDAVLFGDLSCEEAGRACKLFVAESVDIVDMVGKFADISAVGDLYALGHGNDERTVFLELFADIGEEFIDIEDPFGQVDHIYALAVLALGECGGGRKPTCVAPHHLYYGDDGIVVDEAVANDLLGGSGDIFCSRAVAGRVVGYGEVVIDGLGTTHKAYGAAYLLPVLGELVYVDYEGMEENPSNYYDIMAVYMVKHGVGDTATVMNDTSKGWLQAVVNDMCSYTTSTGTKDVEETDADGNVTTVTNSVLYVNVTLKSYRDMISVYGFNSDQVEMLEQIMSPEFMGKLGYAGSGSGGGGGSPGVSSMTEDEINAILNEITDSRQKTVCSYALHRVGFPYSQDLRDSGNYYDCSSLAYYSWKDAGVDISYGGATTAAAEAQGLDEAGKTVSFDELQPGDLIFYSFTSNGRYKNISHVAVYVGNGKVVEALNESLGVVYRDVASTGKIVVIGRP